MGNYLAAMSYIRFYFFIVVLALTFGAFDNMQRKKKKYFVIVTFFAFFMIMAFRNRYMGNDTPGYIALFKKIASFDNPEKYIESSSVEAGFVWFVG